MMIPTKVVLEKARNLIITHGWIQGIAGKDGFGYCLWGAIGEAVRLTVPNGAPVMMAHIIENIIKVLPEPFVYNSLTEWNDHPLRTEVEVLDLLTKMMLLAPVETEYAEFDYSAV